MKYIVALLFVMATGLVSVAQPRFVAETPQQRLSELIFQTPRTVTFAFENKGNEALTINEVHPSCGCIKVTWPETAVEPGEKSEITAVYDARQLGVFHRELAVYTNQQEEPFYLSFQGRVVVEPLDYDGDFPIDLGNVRMNTNYVEFEDVNRGDKPVAEIQVANMEHGAYTPLLMHLPNYLTAEYLPSEIQGGRVGRIRLTLDSEGLFMDGLNQTSIYLSRYMGDKVGEKNEIVVSAVLLPAFRNLSASEMERAPHIVLMDGEERVEKEVSIAIDGKKKVSRTLTVRNEGEETLTVSAVQVFNRALTVSLGDCNLAPHETTKLKITLDTRELERAKNAPRLLLISNDPRQPKTELEIEVEN